MASPGLLAKGHAGARFGDMGAKPHYVCAMANHVTTTTTTTTSGNRGRVLVA